MVLSFQQTSAANISKHQQTDSWLFHVVSFSWDEHQPSSQRKSRARQICLSLSFESCISCRCCDKNRTTYWSHMVTYGHILVRQEAELAQNVLIPDTLVSWKSTSWLSHLTCVTWKSRRFTQFTRILILWQKTQLPHLRVCFVDVSLHICQPFKHIPERFIKAEKTWTKSEYLSEIS